VNKGVLLQT